MYGYIYLTTNLVNGRQYIGMHKSSDVNDDYIGSGSVLRRAIKKHGLHNFRKEIICIAESKEELMQKEIEVILEYDAVNDINYYNIAAGGQCCVLTPEQRSAISKLNWSRMSPEAQQEWAKQMSEANKGKPKSDEHRQKLSEAKTGIPRNWVNVTKEEYSARRKEEVAAGIRPMPKGNAGNKDFRHSEESKALQRQRAAEVRARAIAERGEYMTPEGKESARIKREALLTPERRKQFSEETVEAREIAEQARKDKADKIAQQFLPQILEMLNKGMGKRAIAAVMNDRGYKSPMGATWTDQTVRQMLKRRPEPKPIIRGIDTEVYGTPRHADHVAPFHPEVRFIGWKS